MILDGKGAEHESGQVEAEAREQVERSELPGLSWKDAPARLFNVGRPLEPEDKDRAFLTRYLVVRGGPALDAARTMSAVGFSPADIARGFREAFEDGELAEEPGA